jgi:hypothetical protein
MAQGRLPSAGTDGEAVVSSDEGRAADTTTQTPCQPATRRKTRRPGLLSDAQAGALKQIAHAGGILVTKTPKRVAYPLESGFGAIPARTVRSLIRAGALIVADRGLLFDDAQSYRARRPGDDR